MRIIDRYMLRQFVQIFLICFLSLTGLYVVFDSFSHLDEFLRFSEEKGNLLQVMGEYYAYRSVFFFDQTSGILALISAMFTLTWIQRHNEMMALSAAGVRPVRIMAPVLAAAATISLLAAVNREVTIPALRHELNRDVRNLNGDREKPFESASYDHATDILFHGRYTVRSEKRIRSPRLLLPPELDDLGREFLARDAYFLDATADHPAGVLLRGVEQPRDVATALSIRSQQRPIIITPRDAGQWLKPDECFVVSNMAFEQLTGGSNWQQFSSTSELIAGLSNRSLDYGADVRVSIHSRLMQPFLDLTLLLLGLPLVVSRENRNMFVAIGLSICVVAGFMLLVVGSRILGTYQLLNPALAAWLPLIVCVPAVAATSDALWE
jgi:lipopolysaccharide export system permease protein